MPVFHCPNVKSAIEAKYLSVCKRRNIPPSADYKQKLNEQFEKSEIQKHLVESQKRCQEEWNQRKSCLLSVSKTAQNTVMWAHYSDKHKGAIIGIDFDEIIPGGIWMDHVEYSEQRPKINILTDFEEPPKAFLKTILTKSTEWKYEQEFRAIFLVDFLEDLQKQGLACLKDFNGKKTWFLLLNPKSIKEIIFGLYAEESLKLAIGKLIERAELQHVKLYQVEESETYTLNLTDLKNR
ncbi:MAG: DUF2971 domain-containing protein [Planctomycetota bacterium]|nr:DUF2971 domain-containing protein [Planctomycetota bacterium]